MTGLHTCTLSACFSDRPARSPAPRSGFVKEQTQETIGPGQKTDIAICFLEEISKITSLSLCLLLRKVEMPPPPWGGDKRVNGPVDFVKESKTAVKMNGGDGFLI